MHTYFLQSWCYRCEEDLECFIHANYRSLMKWNNVTTIGDLDFPSQDHFFPWNWLCGPKVPFKIKFIKFERNSRMYDNTEVLLKEDGISDDQIRYTISPYPQVKRLGAFSTPAGQRVCVNQTGRFFGIGANFIRGIFTIFKKESAHKKLLHIEFACDSLKLNTPSFIFGVKSYH